MQKQKPSRKDKDSLILKALDDLQGNVLPHELRKKCQEQGLSRASFFRRLKKLKRSLLIEENMFSINERTVKVYNKVPENVLADASGIEQYLREMESSDRDIKERGNRDFDRMCQNKRTAWYFSSEHNPKFKDRKAVREFFEKRLLLDPENQLRWLQRLNYITRIETSGSAWKHNLYECCKEILWQIALKGQNFKARNASIQVLRQFPETREQMLHWALQVIEEDSEDEDFARLLDTVRSILFDEEGKDKKYWIREKLNELTLQSEKLRKRTNSILQNMPL